MQFQVVISFDCVEDFKREELSHIVYKMDLFNVSKKNPKVIYDVNINPKKQGNAQPFHFMQYFK